MTLIRRDFMEVMADLPKVVAITEGRASELAMSGPFLIHRGIPGYDPRPGWTDVHCAHVNKDVSEAQIEAMIAGSMFGWHVPGADPLNCLPKAKAS